MTEYDEIDYAVEDRIATITIDSPDRNNGFTHTMAAQLIDAAERADADPQVGAVVLTGKGRFFCPGAHLGGDDAFSRDGDGDDSAADTIAGAVRDYGGRTSLAFAALRKPIVSAINGAAIGVGSTMLLPTDVRIASSEARFGFVFVRRGLTPEAASSWYLPRIVGINRALEWVYSGRVFDAQEALEAGLVSRIVEPEDLLDTAYETVRGYLATGSAVALGTSRQLLWGMLSADSPWEAHRLESLYLQEYGGREDVREGVNSFLEKRAPRFPLRVPADYPGFMPRFPERGDRETAGNTSRNGRDAIPRARRPGLTPVRSNARSAPRDSGAAQPVNRTRAVGTTQAAGEAVVT